MQNNNEMCNETNDMTDFKNGLSLTFACTYIKKTEINKGQGLYCISNNKKEKKRLFKMKNYSITKSLVFKMSSTIFSSKLSPVTSKTFVHTCFEHVLIMKEITLCYCE